LRSLTSDFICHIPCEACGSSDACSLYTDSHTYCFSCEAYGKADTDTPPAARKPMTTDYVRGEVKSLPKRNISAETAAKWCYESGTHNGRPVQIANYISDGFIVGQKLRYADKTFAVRGTISDTLYGANLWGEPGRMIVITEGEIDAMSVSQAQGNKWPVVSVPNGAQAAAKALKKNLDWLEKYEAVVLMFDSDEPGRKAAKECAELFSPGKAKIASLPMKDPNDMLVAGREKEIIDAIWRAKVSRPDGIVSGKDTLDVTMSDVAIKAIPYPWEELNAKTLGLRLGELVTFTAGSGIGKSTACREIAYHLANVHNETVGYIALEENVKRSVLGLMSIHVSRPLHKDREALSKEELEQAWRETAGSGNYFFYDHFGSMDSDNLLARIRYLIKACGCSWIVLDHLSIVISGQDNGDERKAIDVTMTKLRSMVEETGCGMLLVSHLKRPSGDRGHEEGAQVSLAQLRGSHSIAQLSDMVIGLERNQQADDEESLTTIRVLKNRFTGETGVAGHLRYDRETGRMFSSSPTSTDFDKEF
jgi:twinkle protein